MIKQIQSDEIFNTPFVSDKSWFLDSSDTIQTVEEGYFVSSSYNFYDSASSYDYGFPTESRNPNGTYKRLVYNVIKDAYYINDVSKAFGLETTDLEKLNKTLKDSLVRINIPRRYFGDKMFPDSVVIHDYSKDKNYTIYDDKYGNLYADGTHFINDISVTSSLNIVCIPPKISFSAADPLSGISSLTVDFTVTVTGTYDSININFGDGSTESVSLPFTNPITHTYSTVGIYSVNMVASGIVGTDSYTRHNYITVNPPVPSGTFSGTPLIGRAPHVVNFTNTIADASTFSWDFGDSGTSTSRNPTYVYHTPGTYTVDVEATGPGGTTDFESIPGYVRVWDVNERLIYSPDTPSLNWVTTANVTHNYVSLVDFQESEPVDVKQLYIIGDGNPGANSISSIRNLNYYTSLTDLKIQNHPQLTSLDVTIDGLSKIENLYCDNNFLNSLVGLGDHPSLKAFHCENNRLTSLGVPNEKLEFCNGLTSLICNNNSLTKLDLSSNTSLQTLYCQGNQITTLTFPNTNTTTLTTVYCYSNKLTTLDVSKLTGLVTLGMGHNSSMTNPVDINYNTELTEFTFGNNFWTTCPNLTNNTKLTKIDCSFNSFQEMDVSENADLVSLYCNNGLLTTLTGLTYGDSITIEKVTILIAHSNRFTSTTIDNILILLDQNGKPNGTVRLDGPGNEKRTSASNAAVTALIGKGWSVRVNT